jgi:hypothetical protein
LGINFEPFDDESNMVAEMCKERDFGMREESDENHSLLVRKTLDELEVDWLPCNNGGRRERDLESQGRF